MNIELNDGHAIPQLGFGVFQIDPDDTADAVATAQRIRENFALFDFELTAGDMAAIDELDRGEEGRTGPHPDRFAHVPS
jgi:diketogulonate reductase-like aldo/keto reductase